MCQQLVFGFCTDFYRRESGHVLYQMVHAVHAAECRQHVRKRADPSESPFGGAVTRTLLLKFIFQFFADITQGSATQRLHDDTLDAELLTFIIEVLGVSVMLPARTGVSPVEEVHLNLNEVPMVFIVVVQEVVKSPYVTMIGETKVADASCLAFL